MGVVQGLRGSGINRDPPGTTRVRKKLSVSRAPWRPQGRGTPARRHATVRGGAHSGAPCTSCSVHAAFHSAALPGPAFVPAGPRCLFSSPGPRRGWGRSSASAPLLPGPREPRQNLCSQPSHSPTAKRARVCASSFPPSSLPPSLSPAREDGPSSRLGLVYSAAEDYIYIQTVSVSPEFPPRHGHRRLVFQIPVLNCTCLADYLWESVGGAEWVENVASLCIRKKTLSPRWRPLPRVTQRETPEPGQPVTLIGI